MNSIASVRSTSTILVLLGLSIGGLAQSTQANTVYDLSHDYSPSANPNGAWSYGWKSTIDGDFTLFSVHGGATLENGVPADFWEFGLPPNIEPLVAYNATTNTAVHDSGQGVYPPGTVWLNAGYDGTPQNFCAIRFTVPAQEGGSYRLESTVQPYLDGDRSGDTDYHVAVNGSEVFGEFLPPRTGTGYTNTLLLAAGDTVDFLVGRGADGVLYGSGLKMQAFLSRSPVQPSSTNVIYDVSRDYSTTVNPNGAWSYGWKSTANGDFTPFSVHEAATLENGVPIDLWELGAHAYPPLIVYNATTNTAVHDSGQGVYPPGTVWFAAGFDGQPQNFCTIRFTVPAQGGGQYHLESAVQAYLNGDRSGDTDYHVVVNGSEVFGEFLPPRTGTGYTNTLHLAAGDTVDFMTGRGADGIESGSGLKIQATLEHPLICIPYHATATATLVNGFVVGATIVDGGCGYTNGIAPVVLIQGGGGSGASATAEISGGEVTAIHIVSAGCCYTNVPNIVIGSPYFQPTLSVAVSKIKVTQHVNLGHTYVIESSSNLADWVSTGPQFTADSEIIVSEFEVSEVGRFFRVRELP